MQMEVLRGMSLVRPGMVCLSSSALHGACGIASQGNVAVKGARNVQSRRPLVVRAATTNGDVKEKNYKVTVLPGDGIGPEIIGVAVDVLKLVGSQEGGRRCFHRFALESVSLIF